MSRWGRIGIVAGLALLIAGVVLAQIAPRDSGGERPAGAGVDDPGPRGLLGLSLLLDGSDHPVERVNQAPGEGGLDENATALLVAPGTLTAGDADALNELAADGGRVVLAGDPGAQALERVAGSPAEVSSEAAGGLSAPLVPAPETSGIRTVESSGEGSLASPAGLLPVLGGGGEVLAGVATVGTGQVVVLADASPLRNELLARADNARLALNLAGPAGRAVQVVESVRTPPGSGVAALPSSWGWTFAGLLAAALVLAAARARRLGPPEPEARPLSPPRRDYVDALAATLVRTRDPAAAAEPLRIAARERLARRAGLPHDFSDLELRRAAVAAGLEPSEARALEDGASDEDEMLAAGGALAKLSRRA